MDSITYYPIDYLWYPMGTNDPTKRYKLSSPLKAIVSQERDKRFTSPSGAYTSPNYEYLGRSTLEHVFLNPREGKYPIFHIYTFHDLYEAFEGQKAISEKDWNSKFAPYFPDIPYGVTTPSGEDMTFRNTIHTYMEDRKNTVNNIQEIIKQVFADQKQIPRLQLTGIKQMLLTWKKLTNSFDGCANLFYRLRATESRPYIRLYPSEGSAITKLHVSGILPIPTLEDPRVMEQWGKEISPTPGIDYCMVKYVHRPSIGVTQPIYGTLQVLNDSSMNLKLQPPKQIRKLDPVVDFRNFNHRLEEIFDGLPQNIGDSELKEISAIFGLRVDLKTKRFSKTQLQNRLQYFSPFFVEIQPLPNESPTISIRYKAVSQYATEDKIFTFITQLITDEEEDEPIYIIEQIQKEFQMTYKEAVAELKEWRNQRGTFTIQVPEEGEFVESYNPGIDIHIYAQHPLYTFHVYRIDSYQTYLRIFTLLSILFLEDDSYFTGEISEGIETVRATIEKQELKAEEQKEAQEQGQQEQQEQGQNDDDMVINDINTFSPAASSPAASSSKHSLKPDGVPSDILGDVFPETASSAFGKAASAAMGPKEKGYVPSDMNKKKSGIRIGAEEQKTVNPQGWFLEQLKKIDKNLFDYKVPSKVSGYARMCASTDDRQPSSMTQDQYDRMRDIYEDDDDLHWIVYPLDGDTEPIQPLRKEEIITIMRYGSSADSIHYYFCPHYYCLSDEIMIREKDFIADTDRNGNPKPENTCPFCHGKLITNKKGAQRGHTVFKRKNKTSSVSYHKHIYFLKDTTHPTNLALPCCFVSQKTLRTSDRKSVV
jgi:hypothetical protein